MSARLRIERARRERSRAGRARVRVTRVMSVDARTGERRVWSTDENSDNR